MSEQLTKLTKSAHIVLYRITKTIKG